MALLRSGGIRKKNARLDIPAERTLNNIDLLISQSANDDEKKELKAQKRLLRNRQAALDSRQRKKKYTESLEDEKKVLEDEVTRLTDFISQLQLERDQLRANEQSMQCQISTLKTEVMGLEMKMEDLIKAHTLDTGILRKKIQVLTENCHPQIDGMVPSTNDPYLMDESYNIMSLDSPMDIFGSLQPLDLPLTSQPPGPDCDPGSNSENSNQLVLAQRTKSDVSNDDSSVTPGVLLLMLLIGAFVSKNSSGSTPIASVPSDVRQASAVVLDRILNDVDTAAPVPSAVLDVSNSIPSLSMPSSALFSEVSGEMSEFDMITEEMASASKLQEIDQLFSLTPSQYASLTESRMPLGLDDGGPLSLSMSMSMSMFPSTPAPSDTVPSFSRRQHHSKRDNDRNARHEFSKRLASITIPFKESAANVYTRSLLWDQIPSEVVQQFKRMVATGDLGGNGGGGGASLNAT